MVSPLSPDPHEWSLQPNQQIERKKLHEDFGGRTQGGIGPSSRTPNVFVFTDPIAGEKHGYFDGWMPDGLFHYSGEGQYGDQRMISGNASILNHKQERRALRVFQGARGTVTYLGEFEVDEKDPWYEADAPETGGGPLRRVIVFRLRSIDATIQPPQTSLARLLETTRDQVEELPLERQLTERTFVNPAREVYEAERKEASLVQALADHLRGKGHAVNRQQILPDGETRPLFTDLFDRNLGLLVEAKGSVTRQNVRMAIGQLSDYGRFLPDATRAILLPTEPRSDLIELAHSQNIVILWPIGKRDYSSSRADFALE
ncbi:restriction endonuclease [Nonomuraea sp. NEAU-A123]|uniref:restriction endonuclease n=1 Tax=Nonomuraea sp. NEAU-A123 TaxID=2839649 RepID=UPI001BE42EFA|nr:restriction endonuclease [Nonomuraea sp. NEAU-A123]MBT2235078.1 restriction endonuclease [Nonomuraea sp. NEAU-A123]